MTQVNVNHTPTPLIKINHDDKSDKNFVELKFHRDPTSDTSDLHEFKTTLFNNRNLEEFLLFVHNFNMNIAASGMMGKDVKAKYLRTLVRGEVLLQFDSIYDDVEGTDPLTVENIILGLYA